jgi:hypothetical protein
MNARSAMSDRADKNEALAEIRRLRRATRERTLTGEFYDDSDIFELDRRLMEAELTWPRSTLRLYWAWYRRTRTVGAVLLIAGAILGVTSSAVLGGVASAIGGVLVILGPVMWYLSRPRRADGRSP